MNRTGTYIAFDALGEVIPCKSDYTYYNLLKAWDANNNLDFKITNSHEKASGVRDTSSWNTLKVSIQQRLRGSKNMLIILSPKTRKSGSVLSEEIEWAVDIYKIPLIITYVDYTVIANPRQLSQYWPNSLKTRLDNGTAGAIHIPFAQKPIWDAIDQFKPTKFPLRGSLGIYSEETYRGWELLKSWESFQNK